VLTTPLFHAFAAVQADVGLTIEDLGHAMVAATQAHGENPLYALERGELSEAEFLALLGTAMSTGTGRPVDLHDFGEKYFAQLKPNGVMIAFLRELKLERGLRLAMLTNNVREWEARWRAMLPVDELFELVVDSAFVGMRKPDPAIYALTLERLGLAAEQCVFVDDIDVNVAAARELGMHAVHFVDTDAAVDEIRALVAR
jgi:putative hydrolase of the HAD superfamily